MSLWDGHPGSHHRGREMDSAPNSRPRPPSRPRPVVVTSPCFLGGITARACAPDAVAHLPFNLHLPSLLPLLPRLSVEQLGRLTCRLRRWPPCPGASSPRAPRASAAVSGLAQAQLRAWLAVFLMGAAVGLSAAGVHSPAVPRWWWRATHCSLTAGWFCRLVVPLLLRCARGVSREVAQVFESFSFPSLSSDEFVLCHLLRLTSSFL